MAGDSIGLRASCYWVCITFSTNRCMILIIIMCDDVSKLCSVKPNAGNCLLVKKAFIAFCVSRV